jgi:hypothetical protein
MLYLLESTLRPVSSAGNGGMQLAPGDNGMLILNMAPPSILFSALMTPPCVLMAWKA